MYVSYGNMVTCCGFCKCVYSFDKIVSFCTQPEVSCILRSAKCWCLRNCKEKKKSVKAQPQKHSDGAQDEEVCCLTFD